jgi:DedD protein
VSSALQNRLVGTVILVALAVIFLPDLLDGKKESKPALFVELPAKPAMPKVVMPEAFDVEKNQQSATRRVEIVDETAQDEVDTQQQLATNPDMQAEQDSAVKVAEKDEPQKNSLAQGTVIASEQEKLQLNAGWVVQLGSFKHQKNVRELLTVLEKSGYRAFSRPVQTNAGQLTKVFVGPDLQKEKLEKALSHLKEITNLQGRITPFTVQ